ncbi:MAG: ABC transporter permease [Saprospiraceae bacterium]|nr:MAG: ABC transporter permease [Saprospiraceae bacterium]
MIDPKPPLPPQWLLGFFRWFCHPDYQEDIEGDLLEKFSDRVGTLGQRKANWLLFRDILSLFRPGIIKSIKYYPTIRFYMLANYFKIAFRTIAKSRLFSLIHILGLAIGVAVCLLILQYVSFEKSYDTFHENLPDLYRVPLTMQQIGKPAVKAAANHPGFGPAMQEDFPEVKAFTRILNPIHIGWKPKISVTDPTGNKINVTDDRIFIVDSTFFSMFSFPLLSGDAKTMLVKPQSVALSATTAKKLFGNENPIGKSVQLNGELGWTVTGVFEDIPENSHLKFSALISFTTIGPFEGPDLWRWPEFSTYVLLKPGSDANAINAKFPAFAEKYLSDVFEEFGIRTSFVMEPVSNIHLQSDSVREFEPPGNERTVYFLTLIAIFIMVIAWLNYINLATAKSIERAKEVGIRKVVGAQKRQLVGQFMSEALIINSAGILLGFGLAKLCLPFFKTLVGKDIGNSLLSFALLSQPLFWLSLIGVLVVSSILTGFYPALVLSSFQPVKVLKGKLYSSRNTLSFRKILVGLQFALSIGLIAATTVVLLQLSFMSKQDLGYNQDQILVVKGPLDIDSTYFTKVGVLENSLLQQPSISSFATSSDIPGQEIAFRNGIRKRGQEKEENVDSFLESIDDDFMSTFEIKFVAGTNFAPSDSTLIYNAENNKVLVNEKLASMLDFANPEDAIGEIIIFKFGPIEHEARIIGVVSNYHQRSLVEDFEPTMYYYPTFNVWKYFCLKVNSTDWSQTIAQVKTNYERVFADNSFEYFFLNEFFDRQYKSEQQFSQVFKLLSFLAIFVTCLGFFGLSTLILTQRRKEISIRKILGASGVQVLYLLASNFLKLLLGAYLVALPIVVYFARQWLDNFAFQVGLKWPVFVIPLLLLSGLILLIVGTQLFRNATLNPVANLKET